MAKRERFNAEPKARLSLNGLGDKNDLADAISQVAKDRSSIRSMSGYKPAEYMNLLRRVTELNPNDFLVIYLWESANIIADLIGEERMRLPSTKVLPWPEVAKRKPVAKTNIAPRQRESIVEASSRKRESIVEVDPFLEGMKRDSFVEQPLVMAARKKARRALAPQLGLLSRAPDQRKRETM